jgi:hypothetical protein
MPLSGLPEPSTESQVSTQTASTPRPTNEAKLLLAEAKETCRSENQVPIRRWTGDRLARERPRLHRLVVAMLSEGLSYRAIRRATLVDVRTIKSVEVKAALSMPTLKREIAGTTARVAKRTIERIEEEIDTLPSNLLGMVYGISVDKLLSLTGDSNSFKIEHTIKGSEGNIFDRMNQLYDGMMKVVKARVIEAEPLQLVENS